MLKGIIFNYEINFVIMNLKYEQKENVMEPGGMKVMTV